MTLFSTIAFEYIYYTYREEKKTYNTNYQQQSSGAHAAIKRILFLFTDRK